VKAAVTGANGLIGANLVRALLRDRHRVVAVVRRTSDLSSLAGLPIELAHADVVEGDGLADAFAGCELVFHAAAQFAYWGPAADALERVAVLGTRNVIDAADRAGARRVVLTSSSVVLGSSATQTPRDETRTVDDDAAEPPYVAAKLRQEREAFARAAERGLELIAVCPTMSVGPYGTQLGPSNAVIVSYLHDPFRMTYPGGCNIVSVADVARGHLLCATRGVSSERYVLGGENLEWPAIHAMISELAGVAGPLINARHAACYAAAMGEEMLAWLGGRPPLTTRTQAKMVGRYYWYSSRKAGAIGYAPRPARRALAEAIGWLAASRHVSREMRAGLLLSREVYEARRDLAQDEGKVKIAS
jgi:dihydroflavonol-4-reductase